MRTLPVLLVLALAGCAFAELPDRPSLDCEDDVVYKSLPLSAPLVDALAQPPNVLAGRIARAVGDELVPPGEPESDVLEPEDIRYATYPTKRGNAVVATQHGAFVMLRWQGDLALVEQDEARAAARMVELLDAVGIPRELYGAPDATVREGRVDVDVDQVYRDGMLETRAVGGFNREAMLWQQGGEAQLTVAPFYDTRNATVEVSWDEARELARASVACRIDARLHPTLAFATDPPTFGVRHGFLVWVVGVSWGEACADLRYTYVSVHAGRPLVVDGGEERAGCVA